MPVVFGAELGWGELEHFGGAEDDIAGWALVAQQAATAELALGLVGWEVGCGCGVSAQGAAGGCGGWLLAVDVVCEAPMAGDLVEQQCGVVG